MSSIYRNFVSVMAHVVLYYHIVWRTKYSRFTITEAYERDLYAYIYGYCKKKDCKLIRIGGMPDHIHILVSIKPNISVSEFMQVLKAETSKMLKEKRDEFPYFEGWANGYAAFTYSEKDKETVRRYIMNQKEHHKHTSFKEEFQRMLIDWGIDAEDDLFLRD